MSAEWERPAKTEQDLRPYTGSIHPLTLEDLEFFRSRYGLMTPQRHLQRGHNSRYCMPIRGPQGQGRGHVLRQPWDGSPLWGGFANGVKADTYIELKGPVQSWYKQDYLLRSDTLVLVEDQLSAIKLWEMGRDAVAMLGVPNSGHKSSYSGSDRVGEIAAQQPEQVIVAFDADMTGQAFLFVKKWGHAFRSIRVAILTGPDIKDLSSQKINEVLGR